MAEIRCPECREMVAVDGGMIFCECGCARSEMYLLGYWEGNKARTPTATTEGEKVQKMCLDQIESCITPPTTLCVEALKWLHRLRAAIAAQRIAQD